MLRVMPRSRFLMMAPPLMRLNDAPLMRLNDAPACRLPVVSRRLTPSPNLSMEGQKRWSLGSPSPSQGGDVNRVVNYTIEEEADDDHDVGFIFGGDFGFDFLIWG